VYVPIAGGISGFEWVTQETAVLCWSNEFSSRKMRCMSGLESRQVAAIFPKRDDLHRIFGNPMP
jgi:hypothetical protein